LSLNVGSDLCVFLEEGAESGPAHWDSNDTLGNDKRWMINDKRRHWRTLKDEREEEWLNKWSEVRKKWMNEEVENWGSSVGAKASENVGFLVTGIERDLSCD
jgi:hypothetical protein